MRRADSEMQKQIEELIKDEADPRERARLLILYQISNILIDNVGAVREVTEKFSNHRTEYDTHIDREEAFINQGRGMWRLAGWLWSIFAVILMAAQGTLMYFYSQHMDAMRNVQAIVATHEKDIETLKAWKQFEDRNGGSTK